MKNDSGKPKPAGDPGKRCREHKGDQYHGGSKDNSATNASKEDDAKMGGIVCQVAVNEHKNTGKKRTKQPIHEEGELPGRRLVAFDGSVFLIPCLFNETFTLMENDHV